MIDATAANSPSKAVVLGLTRAAAIDHARDGIRCVGISPRAIDTTLTQIAADTFVGREPEGLCCGWAAAHPLNRLGMAEEVAGLVRFLDSDRATFITGSDTAIDDGIRSECTP